MVWDEGHLLGHNRYKIESVVATVGLGMTYCVRDVRNQAIRLLKTPHQEQQSDRNYNNSVVQFTQMGHKLLTLGTDAKPNLVTIRDFFYEGMIPCLVMDWVRGQSLWDLVQQQGALPEEAASYFIQQVGNGLISLHAQNLAHQDINPLNIMIPSEQAVLTDVGTIGLKVPTLVSARVFSNPTHLRSLRIKVLDPFALDIYCLAASLYYAVTGQMPMVTLRRLQARQILPPQKINPLISHHVNLAILDGLSAPLQQRPLSLWSWLQQLSPVQPSLRERSQGSINGSGALNQGQSCPLRKPSDAFHHSRRLRTISVNTATEWSEHPTWFVLLSQPKLVLACVGVGLSGVVLGFLGGPWLGAIAFIAVGAAMMAYYVARIDAKGRAFIASIAGILAWLGVLVAIGYMAVQTIIEGSDVVILLLRVMVIAIWAIAFINAWLVGASLAIHQLRQFYSLPWLVGLISLLSWLGLSLGQWLYHLLPISL